MPKYESLSHFGSASVVPPCVRVGINTGSKNFSRSCMEVEYTLPRCYYLKTIGNSRLLFESLKHLSYEHRGGGDVLQNSILVLF